MQSFATKCGRQDMKQRILEKQEGFYSIWISMNELHNTSDFLLHDGSRMLLSNTFH